MQKLKKRNPIEIFMERTTQRLMCVIMAIFMPLPPLYDLEQWKETEQWRRLNTKKDACSGKQVLRHLYAWHANKIGGPGWGEWVAQSPTPFHAIWAFYQIWRKKSPPL